MRSAAFIAVALLAACEGGGPKHDGPQAGECRDPDGDGFGLYCANGADCDETNATVHAGCDWCSSRPEAGCPCEAGELPAECFSAEPEVVAGEEVCRAGERPCVDGFWGECAYQTTYAPNPDPGGGGAGAAAGELGDPTPCGPCDLQCVSAEDDLEEDDITDDNSDGVIWDPDEGGIVIGGGSTSAPYAWIANVSDGTVSKIDQFTGDEVARYYAGPPPHGRLYPSRTAIDAYGNAYVGDRCITYNWWGSYDCQAYATKYAGDPAYCRNGAAVTSAGSVPLVWGTDDCVLWSVPIGSGPGAMVRAVAVSHGDDAHPDGYIWVATTNDVDGVSAGRAYKLDPDNGAVICSVGLPISVYGATSDGGDPEKIWFSEIFNGRLASVDADTCAYEGVHSNADPWCGANAQAYAVTTDGAGNIWQAGWGCGDARRYTPSTNEWCYADTRGYGNAVGITVDTGRTDGVSSQDPQVWVSHYNWPTHLSHFPADAACVDQCASWGCSAWGWAWAGLVCTEWSCLTNTRVIDPASIQHTWLPAGHNAGWGIGVDFTDTNRLWVVGNGQARASVYDPLAGTTVGYPTTPAPLAGPYTYSDFTGFQFRSFVNPEGYYWHDYGDPAVCGIGQRPHWVNLTWDATTPVGTHIRFEARTAMTEAELDVAPVVDLGDTPPETSPPGIDVGAALLAAGQPDNDLFLRLRVVLVSDDRTSTPVFRGHTLDWQCIDSE